MRVPWSKGPQPVRVLPSASDSGDALASTTVCSRLTVQPLTVSTRVRLQVMQSGAPVGLVWQCGPVEAGLAAGSELMRKYSASAAADLRNVSH